MYAAAVCFRSDTDLKKYKDSKIINPLLRRRLAESIHTNHYYAIGIATVEEIDTFNILQASLIAMRRAVDQLAQITNIQGATLLIDGRDKIPNFDLYHQCPVIQGDKRVRVISAASIVAKVARDQFMTKLADKVTAYDFDKNKGYGTKVHRQRIQEFGPTPWHRQTFSGVREYIE